MSTHDDLVARLDELAVIDHDAIAALRDPELGGDDAFLVEVVEAFLEDSPQHVEAIQRVSANAPGAGEVLMRAAHSLKGSCGNFGAARLQAVCAELEARGRANQLDGLTPLAERAVEEYAALADRLRALAEEARRGAAPAR